MCVRNYRCCWRWGEMRGEAQSLRQDWAEEFGLCLEEGESH